MLGLRVARYTDGKKPTPAQALLRALLPWSVLALPLGPFSIAAFLGVYGTGIAGRPAPGPARPGRRHARHQHPLTPASPIVGGAAASGRGDRGSGGIDVG